MDKNQVRCYTICMIVDGKEIKIVKANGFFRKLFGLMFKKDFKYCLCIRCNGIHTFFMRENIDVILTDRNNNIIKIIYNLKPNRIVLPIKGVYYTYELKGGTLKKNSIIKKL